MRLQIGQVGELELASPQNGAWNEFEVVKMRLDLFAILRKLFWN